MVVYIQVLIFCENQTDVTRAEAKEEVRPEWQSHGHSKQDRKKPLPLFVDSINENVFQHFN